MHKAIELYYRGIIRFINGETDISGKYEKQAKEVIYDSRCICRVEEHLTRKEKDKLYEIVG